MVFSDDSLLELLELEINALKSEGITSLPLSRDYKILLNDIFAKHSKNIIKIDANPKGTIKNTGDSHNKIKLPKGTKQEQYEWLKSLVLHDEECLKHVRPGKKLVFGVGNLDAKLFFCGEAPGADEEIQGEPFVGRAGKLLTKIISAMGLSRDSVYISNIMSWRPEMPTEVGNRPPTQQEMTFCLPYLCAEIEIVKPKAIIALGATSVKGLTGDESIRMHDIRGKWMLFEDIPLMPTFHPSYLLRNNTNTTKRLVWEDMLEAMSKVGLPISEKQKKYFL